MNWLRQKGLSLVELMISLAIGSVITVGIVQLFTSNSETYNVMMGQSRMQESARFALDFITRDIQKAGYRGCFSSNAQLSITAPNPDNLPYEYDLRSGVEGYDSIGAGIWSPNLDDIPDSDEGYVANTGIDKASIVAGTDLLTTRNIVQQDIEIRLDAPNSIAQDDLQVVSPVGGVSGLGFATGQIVLVHDCEKATIFYVTDITTGTNSGGDPVIFIEHNLDPPALLWRNSFWGLALKNTFGTDASVSGIETYTYFIAPGAGQNSSGDTPLSLWRKAGTTVPVELVEGVEDLQILYGVSRDGDATPDSYVTAGNVGAGSWGDVKTIRITIVTNTIDDVGGSMTPTHTCTVQTCYDGEPANGIDGLMRRSFTQTIMLRNTS